MRVNRKTLTIAIGLLAVLVLGGGILRAAVWGPNADTIMVCVDQEGNVRFLGDDLKGKYATSCKSNEQLYQLPSSQRVYLLSGEVQVLQTQIADIEATLSAIPTPTPTAVPTATAVPSPTPTPTPIPPTPTPTSTPIPIPGLPADYQAILSILGPTSVILPLVADLEANTFASAFTAVGSQAATFTWSNPPAGSQESFPAVAFNGSSDLADTPGSDYWSSGNGTSDSPFTVGAWTNVTDTAARRVILAKYQGSGAREWLFEYNQDDTLRLVFRNQSQTANVNRTSNAPATMGSWSFVVATYNGSGGAAAMNGVTLYQDGSPLASTAANSGAYVAMSNLGSVASLGYKDSSDLFIGTMAGGPCGPFFTHKALSAGEVAQLYNQCRALLGLP